MKNKEFNIKATLEVSGNEGNILFECTQDNDHILLDYMKGKIFRLKLTNKNPAPNIFKAKIWEE